MDRLWFIRRLFRLEPAGPLGLAPGLSPSGRPTDRETVVDHAQTRVRISEILDEHRAALTSDAAAVLPFAGGDALGGETRERLIELALAVLRASATSGALDWRGPETTDLSTFAADHAVGLRELAALLHLVERTLLDELALDDGIGATSDAWPVVVRVVRTASFDALAAIAEQAMRVGAPIVTDPVTTLHSRAVLDTALEKELRRAERFGHPLAFLLLDVDRLSNLNLAHGYGFGDRVLERIGIVMRAYFREHDWVARHGEDSFGVLLPETPPAHAEPLAEQVRKMVEERLALQDHRTEQAVPVTVSVAVLVAQTVEGPITPADVLAQAEQALLRAKVGGRNRVERIVMPPATVGAPTLEQRRRPTVSGE